ncbi:SH3 domain-containing protein [Pleionea sp. CnH1-48]|uniref:SH3 domain-containing protein n=1 Tax=Pleionea sp. CnH1-48 TaxID=2954494 RepID=UPI00209701B4|nr:SH3 domain-containing protein [Pleionea sp. CnH1-48]MCO7225549.1 SH3 domain-containing protein [Pleionea sp. CnH1-48]
MTIKILTVSLLLSISLLSSHCYAEDEYQQVTVADAFIRMATGPGRGYPVFHVVEQGESIEILKRKNVWFKVRTVKGQEGWVHQSELQKTLSPNGNPVSLAELGLQDFFDREWEFGGRFGDFGGANLLGANATWNFTQNLSAELVLGQALGEFSEIQQISAAINNEPFHDWRFSPYVGIGVGSITTRPSATLVQAVDRTDEALFVQSGLKTYVSNRFLVRLEYRNYVILTSRENNEEVEEWTIGFSVFF